MPRPPKLAPVPRGRAPRLGDADATLRPRPDKDDLEKRLAALAPRIADLTEALYAERRRALLIVLQGRDASGKDGVARRVLGSVHPQGLAITAFGAPTDLERRHDFLWRVHHAVPASGMVGVFNRSHYEDVLVQRVRSWVPPAVWRARYDQINEFERSLTLNGVTVLKFMLHVSREEQRTRFLERLNEPLKNWKFREGDLDDRALWPEYTRAYRDAIRKCNTPWAPWFVVPSDHKLVRDYLIARTIAETLERMDPEYPLASDELKRRCKKELS
ncbi:MAG: polyphosphate kinase 2 family protein [Gemmatimonadetes bacterium]|nr:polyphosphate kinase 2 family protein [Gemmatimonadota bacterium]